MWQHRVLSGDEQFDVELVATAEYNEVDESKNRREETNQCCFHIVHDVFVHDEWTETLDVMI